MSACGVLSAAGLPCEVIAGHSDRTAHAANMADGGVVWWWDADDKESRLIREAQKWREARSLLQEADKWLDASPCSLCGAAWSLDPIDPASPTEIVHSAVCELGALFIMAGCVGHTSWIESPF